MKKLITACTLSVALLGATSSFGSLASVTGGTVGAVFPVSFKGTITYDPAAPSTVAYKNLRSTTSPSLVTKTLDVPALIKMLNHSFTATNIIYDTTGVWQIPSDCTLLWVTDDEFGWGTNDLTDTSFGPQSADPNAGNLALVNTAGFYFPLQATDYAPYPNPVYPFPGPYYIATLTGHPVVFNGAVDTDTLVGSETGTGFFELSFDDLGDSPYANAFSLNGAFTFSISSTTAVDQTAPAPWVATDTLSATGTGYDESSTLALGAYGRDLFVSGGNAFIQATVGISGTSTLDVWESSFFPWRQAW